MIIIISIFHNKYEYPQSVSVVLPVVVAPAAASASGAPGCGSSSPCDASPPEISWTGKKGRKKYIFYSLQTFSSDFTLIKKFSSGRLGDVFMCV